MSYKVIDLYPGSQAQRWLIVHADGRIILHVEYDSYTSMRYGEEPSDVPITFNEIRQRAPHVAVEVELAFERLRARGVDGNAA
jgi:hypothetical protein